MPIAGVKACLGLYTIFKNVEETVAGCVNNARRDRVGRPYLPVTDHRHPPLFHHRIPMIPVNMLFLPA